MSDNLSGSFSETLKKQLESQYEKQFDFVGDRYSEAGFSHTGGGKRPICTDCHLEPRPGQEDKLFEVHALCSPNCPFVLRKLNARQTKDVATQTVPAREPRVDICSTRQMVARTRQASPEERLSDAKNKLLCQMCKTLPRQIVFTPCNHCSCETCAEGVEECMKCHKPIERKIDFYRC